ncbi:ATP-dependent nuclease [Sediminibacillus albus]|uniref:ATP-dependent nuclease n=1 Tax=Sediminibacillus albus TaxID=407036 RepID=UPI001587F958|nr:TOPRIM nucleotidyl transferase/hydrolase domain-containing protein [Sediminibacillus albus]
MFIAVELLLLKREGYSGLKLALIEEIEAHIHTQAQVRLINFLQEETAQSDIQLILTTHSPVLASKISLESLVVCKNDNAFPMGPSYTELELGDYLFLERFLDSTKANLFFAEGVILVEGDAENLLIPTIAEIIDKPLSKYGVSLVNVGNTAFLRYSRVFKRKKQDLGVLDIPVSCITDNDIKPDVYKSVKIDAETRSNLEEVKSIAQRRKERKERIQGQSVKLFISPEWTLEYDIALGYFQKELFKAVLYAEKIQNSDQYGLTDKKIEEVDRVIDKKYEEWDEKAVSNEERAFFIYHGLMITKQISKAITAQCFAKILKEEEKEDVKSRIFSDEKLNYLVNAISYVTDGEGIDD